MLAPLVKIYTEFRQLPIAFQLLAGLLGGGGLVCLVAFLSVSSATLLPVLVILVCAVALFFAVGVIARLVAKKRGRQMDDSLWGETMGKGRAAEEGFDTQAEASAAKEQLARLKDVHNLLREKGYDFYSLPWYLIIGPSQSGKTTLIHKSNQEFPIGDKPVVQFGGTKNCNWFFTNKAILIDTAGRFIDQYTEVPEEKESPIGDWVYNKEDWENLLHLLLKHRSRSPINGIIFCIRVPDILNPDPAQADQTAEGLRKALRDIEERLKIQCPVYIMITMCDRMEGFFEFFTMLTGLSDRSLCGWSKEDLTVGTEGLDDGLRKLSELFKKLRLAFLNEKAALADSDPDHARELEALYAFPEEFETLLEPLQRILEIAFKPSTYHEGLFLRGVYFTSSLQKNEAPVVGACSKLLGGFSLDGETTDQDIQGERAERADSKAFFITDFFEEKVFKEKGCVKLTEKVRERRRRNDIIALTAGIFVAVIAMLWVAIKGWDLYNNVGDVENALRSVNASLDPNFDDEHEDESADYLFGTDPPRQGAYRILSQRLGALWEDLVSLKQHAAWFHSLTVQERIDQGKRTVIQAFANWIFLPALEKYLNEGESPKDWPESLKTYKNLMRMCRLAQGPEKGWIDGEKAHEDWPVLLEALFHEIDSRQKMTEGRLDQLLPLSLVIISQDDRCIEYFSEAMRSEPFLEKLFVRLKEWTLDPWKNGLDVLDGAPGNPEGIFYSPARQSPLDRAWYVDWVYCLDICFSESFEKLKDILLRMSDETSGKWRTEYSFNAQIRQPWIEEYEKIGLTVSAAQRFSRSPVIIQDPEKDIEERLNWIATIRTELAHVSESDMSKNLSSIFSQVEDSAEELEDEIEHRTQDIRKWIREGQQKDHFLLYMQKGGRSDDPGGDTSPGMQVRHGVLESWIADREAFHGLITLDITDDSMLGGDIVDRWDWPMTLSAWLINRLSFFEDLNKRKEGPEKKTRFLQEHEFGSVKEGFKEWLRLCFFREISRTCKDQPYDFIDSLKEEFKEKSEKGLSSKTPGELFPETGFAFTAEALDKFKEWQEQLYRELDEGKRGLAENDSLLWGGFIGDLDSFRDSYIEQFTLFWSENIGSRLKERLPRGASTSATQHFRRLEQLTRWEEGTSQDCRSELKKLLELMGGQFNREKYEQNKNLPYASAYALWQRYSNQSARDDFIGYAVKFFQAVERLNGPLTDAVEQTQQAAMERAEFDVLAKAREVKAGLMAFVDLDEKWRKESGGSEIGDPILSAFLDYTGELRAELGFGAEEMFKRSWPRVMQASNAVMGTFPFQGKELPESSENPQKVRMAEWEAATTFLKSEPLADLAEHLGEMLFLEPPSLFMVDFGRDETETCFRRCVELRRLLLEDPDRTFEIKEVRSGRGAVTSSTLWAFKPSHEEEGVGFTTRKGYFRGPVKIPVKLNGESHRIQIQSRDDARWESYHPLPPDQQDSPWNFLAWLWLWGDYDVGENGFFVKVQFPPDKKKVEFRSLRDWKRSTEEDADTGMVLLVIPPPVFPVEPPDLSKAGWQ